MTSWSFTILYTTSALLFLVLGSTQLHQPLRARGNVNTVLQTWAWTFIHIHTVCVWVFSLICWPLAWLLTAALTRFYKMNVKRWDKLDNSSCKNSFGLLCMQTVQWNTQCSFYLTHAGHWGCCQTSSNHSLCALPTVGEGATLNNERKCDHTWHLCILSLLLTIK